MSASEAFLGRIATLQAPSISCNAYAGPKTLNTYQYDFLGLLHVSSYMKWFRGNNIGTYPGCYIIVYFINTLTTPVQKP